MTALDNLRNIFEPALLKEMEQYGTLQYFKEGDLIMDYGKYIRMMPVVQKGTVKVYRLDEVGNEILLYYLNG